MVDVNFEIHLSKFKRLPLSMIILTFFRDMYFLNHFKIVSWV